jgi:hypothetical protein
VVPTFPACRSARMGAQLCPGSLIAPTPQTFSATSSPAVLTVFGVGRSRFKRPRTASRPISARFEPVQRLRGFARWFLAYAFWPCLPDPRRLAVPARPVVVGAASRPHRRPPDQAAPSFYRAAATTRRRWSFTSVRSRRASWRTSASLNTTRAQPNAFPKAARWRGRGSKR